MIVNAFIAVFFLLASNCYIEAYVPSLQFRYEFCLCFHPKIAHRNELPMIYLCFSWGAAYKGALSFRCSHYFVCFLSHCTMLMSGLGAIRPQKQNRILGYSITRPWVIEWPRSLVDVVIYWNLSLHYWLKTCKYS